MITLKRIYFEPNKLLDFSIPPIVFEKGINFIIGEKTEGNSKESKKMNGVGKSILIESINFCLLKDISKSRISKIPEIILNDETYICLDLEIETEKKIRVITIKRSRSTSKPIVIIDDEIEKEFKKIDDAKDFLESLIISNKIELRPSLRSMLSLLIREESTSFENILYPSGKSTRFNFSELLKPHLFLFGIDLSIVEEVRTILKKVDETKGVMTNLVKDFKNAGINVSEIRSFINELESMVEKLEIANNKLQPSEALSQQKELINNLELKLEKLIGEKSAKKYVVQRIKKLPEVENIDANDIKIIFNRFKNGLGDLVEKSLDQVIEFQRQISDFQNKLMTDKLKDLEDEIAKLNIEIDDVDKQLAKIYEKLGSREKISALKKSIYEYEKKHNELNSLKEKYRILEDKKEYKQNLKKNKELALEKLKKYISEKFNIIEEFEKDLKNILLSIAGNTNCQFQIEVDDKSSDYVKFDYRIKLDGSSGINRIKTFIYDVLLMLNNNTSQRHLGFLIHDNIFASAGRDDMVKSLNFLYKQFQIGKEFQYILTINEDEFDSVVNEFGFEHNKLVRAKFTRKDPFLKQEYREV